MASCDERTELHPCDCTPEGRVSEGHVEITRGASPAVEETVQGPSQAEGVVREEGTLAAPPCLAGTSEGDAHHCKQEAAACTLVSEVDAADLSTADEGHSSWDLVDTDSSEDEAVSWQGFANPEYSKTSAQQ